MHLKRKAEEFVNAFDTSVATEVEWRELCAVKLAQVVLFNKRRSGKAERLLVSQYLDGIQQGKSHQEEFLLSLSPLEKQLSSVIESRIKGKTWKKGCHFAA